MSDDECRQRAQERRRKWRAANPEKMREKEREKARRRRIARPERERARRRRKLAKLQQAVVEVRRRYGGRCSRPGCKQKRGLEVDHVYGWKHLHPGRKATPGVAVTSAWLLRDWEGRKHHCQLLCRHHHIEKTQRDRRQPSLLALPAEPPQLALLFE